MNLYPPRSYAEITADNARLTQALAEKDGGRRWPAHTSHRWSNPNHTPIRKQTTPKQHRQRARANALAVARAFDDITEPVTVERHRDHDPQHDVRDILERRRAIQRSISATTAPGDIADVPSETTDSPTVPHGPPPPSSLTSEPMRSSRRRPLLLNDVFMTSGEQTSWLNPVDDEETRQDEELGQIVVELRADQRAEWLTRPATSGQLLQLFGQVTLQANERTQLTVAFMRDLMQGVESRVASAEDRAIAAEDRAATAEAQAGHLKEMNRRLGKEADTLKRVISRHHETAPQSLPLTEQNVAKLADFGSSDPLRLNAPTSSAHPAQHGHHAGTSRRGAPPSVRRTDTDENRLNRQDENAPYRQPYERRIDENERAELARYRQMVGPWH